MASDDAEALFQAALAHLEASFARSNKHAHYSVPLDTPAPVIREAFDKVREHYPDRIARLDRNPIGGVFSARIFLTKPILRMVKGRLIPK